MEHPLVTFNFNQFPVRIQTLETGEVYFCLNDVCDCLDMSNPQNVLNRLNKKGVCQIDTNTSKGIHQLNFINEPNLYRVIFKSDKPEAKAFQNWVFEEVLPTIRKTGTYSIQQAKCKQYDLAHVYCIENAFGLVKFGIATKPFKRFTAIEANSGAKITQHHYSPLSFNAHEIEKALFKQFANHRQKGEWFTISFDTGVQALNQHFSQLSVPNEALTQLVVNTVERVLDSKQLLAKLQPKPKLSKAPIIDKWQPIIEAYLAAHEGTAFSNHAIAKKCLGLTQIGRRTEMRIGRILRHLNYRRTRVRLSTIHKYFYYQQSVPTISFDFGDTQ